MKAAPEIDMQKAGDALCKALVNMLNAKTRIDVICNEVFTDKDARFLYKRISGHLGNAIQTFKKGIRPEIVSEFESCLMNDERSIQFEHITDLLMEIPEQMVDEVEAFIESKHKEYNKN